MALKEKHKNYSEHQVKQLSDQIVSSTGKMVFVAHYSRDSALAKRWRYLPNNEIGLPSSSSALSNRP
jgi:hypothetical protein